ncbi:hypothetical protein BC829DRAFT_470598 [Chytridium lagenaria]|nr:hypothetical protein BC829DRAFT_470598 [Chytridium lagenaria]
MLGSIGGSISCDSEGRIKWILLSGFPTPGSITPAFGNLTNLEILWLYGDKLTGSIPRELGRLTKLTEMGLLKTGLTGPIPRELGGLKNLRQLWLIENQLSGPIPKELEGLPLDGMHLERNYFTGTVPESFSRINKKGISGNCFNNILNATAYENITQRPFEECEGYLPNTVALSLKASTPSPNLVYEVAAVLLLFVVVSTALTFSSAVLLTSLNQSKTPNRLKYVRPLSSKLEPRTIIANLFYAKNLIMLMGMRLSLGQIFSLNTIMHTIIFEGLSCPSPCYFTSP